MREDLKKILKEVKALFEEDSDAEVYVVIGKEKIPFTANKNEDSNKIILNLLRELAKTNENDFDESLATVFSSVITAVGMAESVGLEKEMIDDINKLLNKVAEGKTIRIEVVKQTKE